MRSTPLEAYPDTLISDNACDIITGIVVEARSMVFGRRGSTGRLHHKLTGIKIYGGEIGSTEIVWTRGGYRQGAGVK